MSSVIKRLRPAAPFELNQNDLAEIEYLLYLWLLGFISSEQLYREVKDYIKVNEGYTKLKGCAALQQWLSAYRWSLFHSFDACVRLKLASLRLIVNEVIDPEQVRKTFINLNLPSDSTHSYLEMIKDPYRWSACKKVLKASLTAVNVMEDFILDPDLLYAQCAADIKQYDIRTRCKKLANLKLSFIAKSNNLETEDLANDMVERAIGYYYRERPFKNRLHAINYVKSSIDGKYKQMIEYWTNPERSRLVDAQEFGEDGVWTNRLRSMSDVVDFDNGEYMSADAQTLWERMI